MITVHRNPSQSEKIALAYLNLSRSLVNASAETSETFVEFKFPADQWPTLYRLIAQEDRQYPDFDPDPEIIPWSR